MDRPRLIRGLRIAWSVWWGILCVLLVVLWVRSYWRVDIVGASDGFAVLSAPGATGFNSSYRNYEWTTIPTTQFMAAGWPSRVWGTFGLQISSTYSYFFVPYWFATLLTATFVLSASRIHFLVQFSLRTLLIATTLIAVVLGLAVAYLRWW